MSKVEETISERGKRYGEFGGHASITQSLKLRMRVHPGWERLSFSQRESLEMIAHKIGRILNGDPNYADSWHDIAGYATLVEQQIEVEVEVELLGKFHRCTVPVEHVEAAE